MIEIIVILSLFGAAALLAILSLIDLKTHLLPNKYVFLFLVTGLVFHPATNFEYLSLTDIIIGASIGSGSLLLIRTISNWLYKADTLGLGDVKLMGAAGAWLGPYFILIALTAGAIAGIIHGLGVAIHIWLKTKTKPNMGKLSLPAGPGFVVGIVIAAAIMLQDLPKVLFG